MFGAHTRVSLLFIALITNNGTQERPVCLYASVNVSKAQQTHKYHGTKHTHTVKGKATNCCCCFNRENRMENIRAIHSNDFCLVSWDMSVTENATQRRRHDFYRLVCVDVNWWRHSEGDELSACRFVVVNNAYRRSSAVERKAYYFMSLPICGQFHRWEAKRKCDMHAAPAPAAGQSCRTKRKRKPVRLRFSFNHYFLLDVLGESTTH